MSSQAEACPGCGHPIRQLQYKFVKVTYTSFGCRTTGQEELNELLRDGWKVVEKREEEEQYQVRDWDNDGEMCDADLITTHYKLER